MEDFTQYTFVEEAVKIKYNMPFFRYPGGKSKIKKTIIKEILKRFKKNSLQYREPFFGGGSIGIDLISNKLVDDIWINDKDIGISCLWTSVINYPEQLKEKVKSFEPSVNSFEQYKKDLISGALRYPKSIDEFIDIGFKKLAIHQISYSGLGTKSGSPLGGKDQKSEYKINCRWSPDYICKKINKINKKFSDVTIKNKICTDCDFIDLIKDTSVKSFLYLDPPYYVKGGELYQYSFSLLDHERLAYALKETRHDWLLSYDSCKEIKDLYSWAKIEEIEIKYSIAHSKEESGNNKIELLITP